MIGVKLPGNRRHGRAVGIHPIGTDPAVELNATFSRFVVSAKTGATAVGVGETAGFRIP